MPSPPTTQAPLNIVVLISGSGQLAIDAYLVCEMLASAYALVARNVTGTNLQALIDAVPSFQNPTARISLVISNSKFAKGIQRTQAADPPIAAEVFSMASFRKNHPEMKREAELRSSYDRELAVLTKKGQPHLVVLAGFMHILSPEFLEEMQSAPHSGAAGRIPIINLHPALPGQFDGVNAIRRAWEAGPDGRKEITQTGVMVHEVIPEVDRGPVVSTRIVELRNGEPLEALELRMHQAEHELIVAATLEMLRRLPSSPPK